MDPGRAGEDDLTEEGPRTANLFGGSGFGPGAPADPLEPTQPLSGPGASTGPDPETQALSGPRTPPQTPPSDWAHASVGPTGEVTEAAELPQPVPGAEFLGRYLVEKRIGVGGMGEVWLVRHLALDTPRALKLITANVATNPEIRARFRREARIMARLSHPHAVAVHDARFAHDGAFIEMEFIRGRSLNQFLMPGRPMPPAWTARILGQLCDVLQAAHANGVVHRDLKPSNLMLLDDRPPGREFLKVLDFGIAKILGPHEGDAEDLSTRTGAALFTPQYASPEQVIGGEVDTRGDLYAIGVLLYELLTGSRPFSGHIHGVMYHHLHTPPPPFAETNPAVAVPPGVEALVLRCLAKRPEDRPQTARELIEEFRREGGDWLNSPWAGDPSDDVTEPAPGGTTLGHRPDTGAATQALTAPVRPTSTATLPAAQAVAAPAPVTRRRPRRKLAAAMGATLLVGATGLGVFLLNRKPAGPRIPEGYARENPTTLVRKSDGVHFHLIPGGNFVMGHDPEAGGPGPRDALAPQEVGLGPFYLQEYEVTNAELTAYFQDRHIRPDNRPPRWSRRVAELRAEGVDPDRYPAVGMTHELAASFAEWAGGRLPTEAEWEYAARSGGKRRAYVWGDAPAPNPRLANINSVGDRPEGVAPPGTYSRDRTEQGIADMTGNVREWCLEGWLGSPGQAPAEKAATPGHVLRGGSYLSWPDESYTTGPPRPRPESQTAQDLEEDGSARDLGFRVALPVKRD